MKTKEELVDIAIKEMEMFCKHHGLIIPDVVFVEKDHRTAPSKFGVCAYYRKNIITIELKACARIGLGGREWSFPHYRIDRTPYGVIAHELGHHVDLSSLTNDQRKEFEEAIIGSNKITNYEPNIRESFAETFRLYFTNPNLLEVWSPSRYKFMKKYWTSLYEKYKWEELLRLKECPERQINQIKKNL